VRSPAQARRFGFGAQRFEYGGLAAVGLIAALMVWVAVETTRVSSTAQAPNTTVTANSVAELESQVAAIRHWVFWVGPRNGVTYELTQQSDGTVRIRYLPRGAAAGSSGSYLTVATYPFLNPFSVIAGIGRQSNATAVHVPGSGVGAYPTSDPSDVHVAYPGVDFQIEVFDPTPGAAPKIVNSGQLTPVSPA
jgi:hypothetical protein